MNIVKHIQGGQFGPLGPQKNVTREPQKRSFLAQNWPFLGASGTPQWHFLGALMVSTYPLDVSCNVQPTLSLVQPFFGALEVIKARYPVLRDLGASRAPSGPPRGPKRGPRHKKRWAHQSTTITKTIKIICKVWLMKNKICPTSTTLLLLSTL